MKKSLGQICLIKMCFTPTISLLTALIEFTIATIILIFFRKSLVNKFFVTLVYVLGIYQFTEFMLCVSTNPVFWSKLGFIAYTFLPAIALYYLARYSSKKENENFFKLIYIIPIFYTIVAITAKTFITKVECSQFFVIGRTALYAIDPLLSGIYSAYYAIAILLSFILILQKMLNERNKTKKKIQISILSAIFISLIPALILVVILPSLEIYFPSIYCEFAILFSIAALVVAQLDKKLKK